MQDEKQIKEQYINFLKQQESRLQNELIKIRNELNKLQPKEKSMYEKERDYLHLMDRSNEFDEDDFNEMTRKTIEYRKNEGG